jgi:hypothetical protein
VPGQLPWNSGFRLDPVDQSTRPIPVPD